MSARRNEYWVTTDSLLHTDTQAQNIDDPQNVRHYLLSSIEQTGGAGTPPTPGICSTTRNSVDPYPALRALFVALDRWLDSVVPHAQN